MTAVVSVALVLLIALADGIDVGCGGILYGYYIGWVGKWCANGHLVLLKQFEGVVLPRLKAARISLP